MQKIDWDNYEVIELEDLTTDDIVETMEEVREVLETVCNGINAQLEEILEDLGKKLEEYNAW